MMLGRVFLVLTGACQSVTVWAGLRLNSFIQKFFVAQIKVCNIALLVVSSWRPRHLSPSPAGLSGARSGARRARAQGTPSAGDVDGSAGEFDSSCDTSDSLSDRASRSTARRRFGGARCVSRDAAIESRPRSRTESGAAP